jgi:tRNA(Ile)-lysidine synthase
VNGEGLAEAFENRLRVLAPEVDSGAPVVVACSGGLDSMVLLHLLLFKASSAERVAVAHLDHAMRDDSAGDALWLSGVCRAWNVELVVERCPSPPRSEDAARTARYSFFERVRSRFDSPLLATAHHADDQAETVLFRVLRGAGVDGLTGIAPRRPDGIVRPLLPWTREELETYADEVGLTWREDWTNVDTRFARNALRHVIIPRIESDVAPGARKALVRLGAAAAVDRRAWGEAIPLLLQAMNVHRTADSVELDVASLAALGRALRTRVTRSLVEDLEHRLDHDATTRAIEFVEKGRSGSRIELGGGIEMARDLDRLVLRRIDPKRPAVEPDRALEIPSAVRGSGDAVVGGRPVHVEWAAHAYALPGGPVTSAEEARFSLEELDLPLRVRGRSEGDRIGLAGGTRPLKKVLLEARIPSSGRDTLPILVDAADRVLWVPGVARSRVVSSKGRALTVRIG